MPQVLIPKIIVAASDAPSDWKQRARFVCDGTDDNVQIQAAIDALPASGGRVELSPGNFYYAIATTDNATVELSSNQSVFGHGDETIINLPAGATDGATQVNFAFRMQGTSGSFETTYIENASVSNLRILHRGCYGGIRMLRARWCRIENISGEGVDTDWVTARGTFIPTQLCYQCTVRGIKADAPKGSGRIVTFDSATNTITLASHGYSNGGSDVVVFSNSGGALPAEIEAGRAYWVRATVTTDTFQISSTNGGAVFGFTDDGSGTSTVTRRHANYVCVSGSQNYQCLFDDIASVRHRSAIDGWGYRDCSFSNIRSEYADEGMDIGNIADCTFNNIIIRNSSRNGITLKEEPGTSTERPAEYAGDLYTYGSDNNAWNNITVKNYGVYGIGWSGGAGSSPIQAIDRQKFVSLQITNDNPAGIAAIRIGTGSSTGTLKAVTFDHTTDRLTVTSHGYAANAQVYLDVFDGFLPRTLRVGKTYYVIVVDTNTIQLAETSGGTAVEFADNGFGTSYIASGNKYWNDGFQVIGSTIDVAYGHGIQYPHMRNCSISNSYVACNASGSYPISAVSGGSDTNFGKNNSISACTFEQKDQTQAFANICAEFTHQKDLSILSCNFIGGRNCLQITNSVGVKLANVTVRDCQGIGVYARPAITVNRTRSGSVDWLLDGVTVHNANLQNASLAAVRFESNGSIVASIKDIVLNNVQVTKDPSAPTQVDAQWISTNGGTYENVRRINNTIPTGPASTLPTGASNTNNNIGAESANAETPTLASWQVGDIVNFTDSGDATGNGTYLKVDGSTWVQLA